MKKPKTRLTHWEIRKGGRVLQKVIRDGNSFFLSNGTRIPDFPQVVDEAGRLRAKLTPRFMRLT